MENDELNGPRQMHTGSLASVVKKRRFGMTPDNVYRSDGVFRRD